MSVDYRLLEHFQASWERFEAARRALPEPWRQDARPAHLKPPAPAVVALVGPRYSRVE